MRWPEGDAATAQLREIERDEDFADTSDHGMYSVMCLTTITLNQHTMSLHAFKWLVYVVQVR